MAIGEMSERRQTEPVYHPSDIADVFASGKTQYWFAWWPVWTDQGLIWFRPYWRKVIRGYGDTGASQVWRPLSPSRHVSRSPAGIK